MNRPSYPHHSTPVFKPLTKAHEFLCAQIDLYHKWHHHPRHKQVHVGILGVTVVLIISMIFNMLPHSALAQEPIFTASWNSSSLNADSGPGGTAASNDGTPASLVDGYGVSGQGVSLASAQTLKYPLSNNLDPANGAIEMRVKLSYAVPNDVRGPRTFSTTSGVAYDTATGFIFVADPGNNRIVKSKIDGSDWVSFGKVGLGEDNFQTPGALAYNAATGDIYIADTGNNRIVKTQIDGTGWTAYGTSGSGTGNFSAPVGISFNASTGDIYIADTGNNRIVKTQIDGTGWTAYGTSGSGTGNFSAPAGASVDSATGDIYIADTGNNRIVKTQIDGTGWTAYGTSGSGTGNFSAPAGIFFDATGIYISDTGNNRIVRTSIAGIGWVAYGTLGSGATNLNSPRGIFFDAASAQVYIGDSGNNRVSKIKLIWTTLGTNGTGASQFKNPMGATYDSSTGYYYIADFVNHRIVKTKIDGTGWTTLGGLSAGSGVGQFSYPADIDLDPATGFLYIADRSNSRIVKTKIDGTGWTTLAVGGNIYTLDYDPASDYIYYGDYDRSRIAKVKIDGSGQVLYGAYGTSGTGKFNRPHGISYDASSDYVYVADESNSCVVKTKMDGTGWTRLNGFSAPQSIDFDAASSSFYVANKNANNIIRTQIDGTGWTAFGSNGTGPKQFSQPTGIIFDASSGNITITDGNSHRIAKTAFDDLTSASLAGYTPDPLPADATYKTLLTTSGANPMSVYLDAENGRIHYAVSSGAAGYENAVIDTPVYFDASSWHTIKVSYTSGGLLRIYIDGTLASSKTVIGGWAAPAPGDNFYIGSFPAGVALKSLDGVVDDLKLYSYQDNIAPSAPANVTGKDVVGGSNTLVPNSWNRYDHPYFSWDQAVDTAQEGQDVSGFAGQYVYFGTDNTDTLDPATTSGIISASGSAPVFQVTNNTTVAGTIAGDAIYYLRVKVKDFVGNSHVYTLCSYRYDVTPPLSPVSNYISVSPTGFSNTNAFTFTWPAIGQVGAASDPGATDNPLTGSNLAYFDYKVNSGSWTKVNGDSAAANDHQLVLSGSSDVIVGTNTFYLRAVDVAGNIDATPSQIPFYYDPNSAQAPKSITVAPTTTSAGPSQTNSFTISWVPPDFVYEKPQVTNYEYAINDEVTQNSTFHEVPADTISIGPSAFATKQGRNIVYVVAKNSAGSVNYAACRTLTPADENSTDDYYDPTTAGCAMKFFYASTSAPGAPTNLAAVDGSDRELSKYTVFLKWTAPTNKGTGFNGYSIYRSTNGTTWGDPIGNNDGENASTSYADDPTDLASTLYYYKVVAKDMAGQISAPSDIVSITPTGKFKNPPVLVGEVSQTPKAYSATISWTTADADPKVVHKGQSFIEYGTEATKLGKANGGDTVADLNFVDQHSLTIKGLIPDGTKYYYQAVWIDADGNRGQSSVMSFLTLDRPTANQPTYSNITLSSVSINYTTSVPTTTVIIYGKSKDSLLSTYPPTDTSSRSSEMILSKDHTINLTGLDDSSTYNFRIQGKDTDDNPIDIGAVYDFSTLTMPKIDGTVAVDQDKESPTTTYRFSWKTNVETTTVVYFKTDSGAEQSKSAPDYTKDHSVSVSDLADMSTYQFRVTGVDRNGINVDNAYTTSLDTPKDSRPPKITGLTVEVKSSGFSTSQKAQVIVSWQTDELATSQVEYAQGISGTEYNNKSKEDAALSNSHVVILGELEPSKIYHLRAVSKDNAGNAGHSDDTTTITGKMQSSVLDIIVNSLERSLGWLFGIFK